MDLKRDWLIAIAVLCAIIAVVLLGIALYRDTDVTGADVAQALSAIGMMLGTLWLALRTSDLAQSSETTAAATKAYAETTVRLATETARMAQSAQASVDEMRRQFDEERRPDLILVWDGGGPGEFRFNVHNVSAAVALDVRVRPSYLEAGASEPRPDPFHRGAGTPSPQAWYCEEVVWPHATWPGALREPRDGAEVGLTWRDAAGGDYGRRWRLHRDDKRNWSAEPLPDE